MTRLMRFYAGGIDYEKMETMPLVEFFELVIESRDLVAEEKASIERARNGK